MGPLDVTIDLELSFSIDLWIISFTSLLTFLKNFKNLILKILNLIKIKFYLIEIYLN